MSSQVDAQIIPNNIIKIVDRKSIYEYEIGKTEVQKSFPKEVWYLKI